MFNKIDMNSLRYLAELFKTDNSFISKEEYEVLNQLLDIFQNDLRNNNIEDLSLHTLFFCVLHERITETKIKKENNYISEQRLIEISLEEGFYELFKTSIDLDDCFEISINIFYINAYSLYSYLSYQNKEKQMLFFKYLINNTKNIEDVLHLYIEKDTLENLYETLKDINKEYLLVNNANKFVSKIIELINNRSHLNPIYQKNYYKDIIKYAEKDSFKITISTFLKLIDNSFNPSEDQEFFKELLNILNKEHLKKQLENTNFIINETIHYKTLKNYEKFMSEFFNIELNLSAKEYRKYSFKDFCIDEQIFIIKNTKDDDKADKMIRFIVDRELYISTEEGLKITQDCRDLILVNYKN